MRIVKVAATQMACSSDREENRANAERLVRLAAGKGANVILLQELYQGLYFCQNYDNNNFDLAIPDDDPYFDKMAELAKELHVVLPISFFEKDNNCYFNAVMMIDADGTILGKYRKLHIPDDPGYFEKFYFSPGDLGIRVWDTGYGKIGLGICWDQWFPEVARIMALKGAEIILYPTAIGHHTNDMTPDCSGHWKATMCGHAAANMVPVVASNRVGVETGDWTEIDFYGHSFIAGPRGEIIQEAGTKEEAVLVQEFDLDEIERFRRSFVLFRDRRPEIYEDILTLTGK